MIKTRGRKILRDIMARKGRTIMVALSIMIGVFGAVALMSTNDLILTQIEEDINPDEIAMARLFVTVPTAGTEVDNDAYLSMLNDLPGVTDAEGQTVAPVFWKRTGDEHFSDGDIMAFSEPFGEITLEPMRLVNGEWPQPGQNQIAIEKRMVDETGLAIGDTIVFRSLGSETGDTASQEWTITATVFHPYWVVTGDDNMPEQRIYANYDDAQQIAGFSGFSTIYLRYVDTDTANDQADQLEEAIARETNYIPLGVWLDDPDNYFLLGEVKEITGILDILAIVALVVSGFLVTNVINTIVVEQKGQIGVLKSVGATRWDNFFVYAGVAFIYGVIGTIPGVVLGVIVGSAMAQSLAPIASTLIEEFSVSPLGVVVGVVMGLLVPMIAAFVPVFNGTRVSIIDAMTDLGISGKWGTGPIARLVKALPLPVNIRQALSNVVQKKGRLALTVITLTLATAAFMGVFAMFTVVTSEIDKLYDTFNYEIVVIPTEAQDFDQVRSTIIDAEGVEAVYPGVGFTVEILDLSGTSINVGAGASIRESTELPAFGFDPATSTFDMTYTDGTGWRDDPARDGVVLSKKAAELADKKAGDMLVISAGGRTAEYEVIGVHSYPFAFVGMKWQDLAQLAGFVTDDNGTPDDFTDDTPLPTLFFVALTDKELTGSEVDPYIDDISERILATGITASYENQVESQETDAEDLMTFQMVFQMMSAVMAAVGAIGLLTTLSMAVFERQKEIGVMRSIGAGSGAIISQFLVEGILIGIIAWIVAIPLSYLLAVGLLNALEFGDFIDFQYPVWVLGLGLVGMVIIATVASLWPSIAAARRTVSDILRYQ
jgi:putative ABC transport system permease protein